MLRERDHGCAIGYDDVFWYPEGIACIVLTEKVRLTFVIWAIGADLFLLVPSGRHTIGTAFRTFRSRRLEPRILQDVL